MDFKEKKIGVAFHLYYYSSLEWVIKQLALFKQYNAILFFNICSVAPEKEKLLYDLRLAFPDSFIIETPNVGKDIGGKLAIIDLYIQLNLQLDFIIFLHDKKSPHSALGETWRKKLFRIVEPENIETIIEMFEKNKKLGIVGAKELITNEYDKKTVSFSGTNDAILKELIGKHHLQLNSHDFIGGTMFWIRAEIIRSFFSKHSPLNIRASLEKGNVLDNDKGTYTHAWERMLSWVAINAGYLIKGI